MLLSTLRHNLRKCNPNIFIDVDHEVTPFGYKEFPTSGLYIKEQEGTTKFLMGVPHIDVPEYTIAAVDFDQLAFDHQEDVIREIKNTNLAIGRERIIWRGWRAIVNNLIRMGYVSKSKAQKVFNTYFEPERLQLPRHYINRVI